MDQQGANGRSGTQSGMQTGKADAGSREQRRAAPRASLVLRSAKVICRSGEYVCLVRDVSETGTGLSFLHDVPPDERMILQLTNGCTYPIERVWQGERQAGYRFAAPVDRAEFIAGESDFGHRALRLSLHVEARIIDGRERVSGELANLSAEGAGMRCEKSFAPGRIVSLALPGLAPRLAEIRWQGADAQDDMVGMRFTEPMATGEFAEAALVLQPFAPLADETELGDKSSAAVGMRAA